jgi:hypothetical protein
MLATLPLSTLAGRCWLAVSLLTLLATGWLAGWLLLAGWPASRRPLTAGRLAGRLPYCRWLAGHMAAIRLLATILAIAVVKYWLHMISFTDIVDE